MNDPSKKSKVNKYGDEIQTDSAWDDSFPKEDNVLDNNEDKINFTTADEISLPDRDVKSPPSDDEIMKSYLELRKRKSEVSTLLVCGAGSLVNFCTGGVVGMLVGTTTGLVTAYSSGLHRSPLFMRYVYQSATGTSWQFGSWLGAYSCGTCCARGFRRKDDLLNTFIGGSFAGAVTSLRSRNIAAITGSAVSGGIIMVVLEGITKFM